MSSNCLAASTSRTPAQRRPLDGSAVSAMLLFCIVIGFQQVAIKAVAADISPLAQIALRSAIAAVIVGVVARQRHVRLADARLAFGSGLLVGLGFTSEFTFVALGLNYTLASHMAVFLYTAPVFAALGLHFLVPGEALAPRHWLGVGVAFAGMVLAMAPNTGEHAETGSILFGDFLGLLAGLSWAATTLVVRRSALSEAPPTQTLFYQLTVAGVILVPAAYALGDLGAIRPTALALSSLAFQTLAITAAILLWFSLLRRYLASRLGIFSFLSPLFGVIFGTALLGDPLTWNFLIGGIAILAGLVLVSR